MQHYYENFKKKKKVAETPHSEAKKDYARAKLENKSKEEVRKKRKEMFDKLEESAARRTLAK